MTWSPSIERWAVVLRAADRSEGTIATRTGHIWQFARWAREVELHDVDETLVTSFVGEHSWSKAFRRSIYVSLRQFFRWAHGVGLVNADPARTLPMIGPSKTRRQPASEDAVWAAWSRANEREKLIMRLANEHGLRRSEVAQVHVNDVLRDLLGWVLVVHGKGSKDRLLPIDESFALELHRVGADTGWVFPGRCNGHLSPRWVGTLTSRLLPGDDTMHSLRHRFASVTFQSTGNVRVVQEALGHENLNTTQMYLPTDLAMMRQGLARASARLAPQPPNVARLPIETPAPIEFAPSAQAKRWAT